MAMLSKVIAAAALVGYSQAGLVKRVDNTQPAGTNPIGQFSVQFLGNQTADNSCTHRDLGFAGRIGDEWFALYGDNDWCDSGVTDPDKDTPGFHGLVRDSVSLLGSDPLKVHDLNLNDQTPVAHPNQFVPYNTTYGESNLTGFGGTSVVEVDASNGIGAVYYLVNESNNFIGAGIAQIQHANHSLTVTKRYGDNGYWWDSNIYPHYGDIATYQDEHGEYTYILGNPPNNVKKSWIYQARVKSNAAFDLSQYEYWWGRQQGWKSDMLTTFTLETAVMSGAGQGQMLYSNYFNCYFYVHMGGAEVRIRTASAPEGPWSADTTLYTDVFDGGYIYGAFAYPYLDTSGKTLTVAWFNNGKIRVAKIAFN